MQRSESEMGPAILIAYCFVAGSGFIVGTLAGWLLAML